MLVEFGIHRTHWRQARLRKTSRNLTYELVYMDGRKILWTYDDEQFLNLQKLGSCGDTWSGISWKDTDDKRRRLLRFNYKFLGRNIFQFAIDGKWSLSMIRVPSKTTGHCKIKETMLSKVKRKRIGTRSQWTRADAVYCK